MKRGPATPAAILVTLSIALVLIDSACGDGRLNAMQSEQKSRVQRGMWGGRHVGLEVTDTGATVEYDCAHGTIDVELTTDRSGRFDLPGRFVKEHPGPVREGEDSSGQAARYFGRVEGEQMTLTVKVSGSGEELGPFSLTYNKPPIIRKCG